MRPHEEAWGSGATSGVGGMVVGPAECEGASLVMFTSSSDEELRCLDLMVAELRPKKLLNCCKTVK